MRKRSECPVVYSRSLRARSITLWYMDRTDPAASHPGSAATPPAQADVGPGVWPAGTPETGQEPQSPEPPETEPGFLPGGSPETEPGFLPAAPADTLPGTPAGTGPQFVPRIPPETVPGLVPWPRTMLGMSAPHHGSVHQPAVGALQARLAREPRKLGWILRAVASAVAGGIVSVVAGWRLGGGRGGGTGAAGTHPPPPGPAG